MKTEKRKIGDIGEGIAARFLMKRGFSVIERNYLKPWGEIDIIAKKKGKIYFVEVKTVSHLPAIALAKAGGTFSSVAPAFAKASQGEHETPNGAFSCFCAGFRKKYFTGSGAYEIFDVSCEPFEKGSHETETDRYRPEDNLHPWKLERLKRTILTYLEEKGIGEEGNWQFDAICVYLNEKDKTAQVERLEEIVL
jgi:Holliday junction resolvase-like predicted endonuclease